MSDKIRNINGKRYYGKIDITSPAENEDFEFDKYQPNPEKPNDIEDFYFYIKNKDLSYPKNGTLKLNYPEISAKLLEHFRNKIDAEIEKLNTYSEYYKNRKNSTNNNYSPSTAPSTSKKSNNKSDEYNKQIRKLAQIYSDLEASIKSANGDAIIALYEKYVDPNFGQYIDDMKERESMHNAYIYGKRETLDDPDERYKPIEHGSPYTVHRNITTKDPEAFNGDPEFYKRKENEKKAEMDYERSVIKELYEDPKDWLERHPEAEDQEERFKYFK